MSFSNPQFLWLLLSLPLILILHFLRARAHPQPVSALFLWEQAKSIARQKRRFSATWLLLLQLLTALIISFALARPFIKSEVQTSKIFVVDASASMATVDSVNGQDTAQNTAQNTQRITRAASEIRDLLANTRANTNEVALIRAGLDAQVITPLTTNHNDLLEALNDIQATDSTVNLNRAINLAASLKTNAEIHLVSDNIKASDIQLNSKNHLVTTHVIQGNATNVGISAFELRGNQAFVSVVSNYPRPQQLDLNLYLDDAFIGQTPMLIPRNGQMHWSFPIQQQAGTYKAEIVVPDWDALALDNTAYALSRDLKVLISPPEPSFERALLAIPNIDIRISNRVNGRYDLLITNDIPAQLEPGRYIFYSPRLEQPDFQRIADWDATNDFLRFSDLSGARAGFNPTLTLPMTYKSASSNASSNANALDEVGSFEWQTIIESEGLAPMMLYSQSPQTEAIAFTFHPSQSDLVRRSAFPILMANIIRSFSQEKRLPLGSALGNNSSTILLNGESYPLNDITQPGIYTVDGQNYSSSLLSREESSLAMGDIVNTSVITQADSNPLINQDSIQNTSAEENTNQRTFTQALILLAITLILLEWLFWALRDGWRFRDLFKLRPAKQL